MAVNFAKAFDFDPALVVIAFVVSVLYTIYYHVTSKESKPKLTPLQKKKDMNFEKLEKHTNEFNNPQVLSVCNDKIHIAIGFGLANAIVIEGDDGCVLIDTLESNEAAEEALQALKKVIKDKPIVAIILTHFHADHTYGLETWAQAYPGARVYAHKSLEGYFRQLLNVRNKITQKRAVFQFGTHLDDEEHENSGIGIKLKLGLKSSLNVRPTHVFEDSMKILEGGLQLVLYHAPGETNDQIIVHWPEKEVLFPADNIYRAFPNLYAVRGTATRDTLLWVKAVDLMRSLKPKIMVPQHTRPIEGQDKIEEILTSYRDAIQLVHDQTVRYMNKGLYPDEITHKVYLPPALANHPFLQEFYGTVEWSVKGVFNQYMGWFSGKATELHPMERLAHSKAMVDLAGGAEKMCEKMKDAYLDEQFQWSLELAQALLDTKSMTDAARTIKVNSLRQLALNEISANGRNWYLTEALIEEGLVIKPTEKQVKDRIYSGSLYDLFLLLTVMVDLDKTADIVETAHFHFTDCEQHFVLKLRRGVLELVQGLDNDSDTEFDLVVTTTESTWRGIIAKDKAASFAVLKGELDIKPRLKSLQQFMDYFDTN